MHCLRQLSLLFLLPAIHSATAAEGLPIPSNPMYEAIQDTVYLQEIPTLIPTDRPLTAVAVHADTVWVGDDHGVYQVQDDRLVPTRGPTSAVHFLEVLGDTLYAGGAGGLWAWRDNTWARLTELPVADVCLSDQRVILASGSDLWVLEDEGPRPVSSNGSSPVLGVALYAGTIYVHDGRRVGLLMRGRLRYGEVADFGQLEPGCHIRDLLSVGSRLVLATDEGLCVLRGATWYEIRGEDGLCYEDTTCLERGFDRDLWIGTARGAIRQTADDFQFFGHSRWIPHDHVNAVASGDRIVCIATDGGLSIIRYEPWTLAKKAAYYERWLDEWGMKRLGFIHILFLEDGHWVREVSDNDVGYSSHYLSAKCFEYAVTGNETARATAVDMMKTVKWSEEISSIEGFPARSIYAVGEFTHKAQHGSGGLPAEWHATENGIWEWKGDTSSDEVDAHVYETTVFLKLAASPAEQVWATDHLNRVVGHIVDNGFVLRDVDGKPTRWARWDPDYLQRPYGAYAAGLNGMEAFNYLTTAEHFTKDIKFSTAKDFHRQQGYLPAIVRQKVTFPPQEFTHFDDRLAFYSYFPLIQLESDPELKSVWLRSLERTWEIKRAESVPWFNFIYGALTGNDCESRQAVDHLRGWPLDLVQHSYTNSHRHDLHMPDAYRTYSERPRRLNPRETGPQRWDSDFMQLDGGRASRAVADPGGWLEAYWMGRYYGMITAPQTDDRQLTSVAARSKRFGAVPWAGPQRPLLQHER